MKSSSEHPPRSGFRIIMILFSGYVLGNLVAALLCYLQPKIYESTGAFTEWATPDQSSPLARAHAATLVSDLQLDLRWELTFEDAVKKLIAGVSIESAASNTVIRARFPSAQDSRQIVEKLMKSFPGIEREHQWARIEGHDGHYTEKESENLRLVQQLRSLILESLGESGNYIPGSLISTETVERIGDKDLLRQFKAYQKAALPKGRFSPPDGNILVPLSISAEPYEPRSPVSPDIDNYFLVGRIAGLLVAGLALLAIQYLKPSLIEVPPAKSISSPAWAEAKSTTQPDQPTW